MPQGTSRISTPKRTLQRIPLLIILITLCACIVGVIAAVTHGRQDPSAGVAGTNKVYNPGIDPNAFAPVNGNSYFPLTPGMVQTYKGTVDGEPERNVVTVTKETKVILGVTCTVVRDQVYAGDTLVEETYDWYAVDTRFNVWYFGEDSREYENGTVASTHGSWEAGKDGAKPGIVMKGVAGNSGAYRQEYRPGIAEDLARVVETGQTVTVPAGSYSSCIKTNDWTPLEPGLMEEKYFCPDVGWVKSSMLRGGQETWELVSVTRQ